MTKEDAKKLLETVLNNEKVQSIKKNDVNQTIQPETFHKFSLLKEVKICYSVSVVTPKLKNF